MLIGLLISSFVFGQTKNEINSKPKVMLGNQNEKKQIDDFTVILRTGIKDTYFFDILKKGETTPIRTNYSITLVQEGYKSKEDAFKAAASLIQEYKVTGHFPPINPPQQKQ